MTGPDHVTKPTPEPNDQSPEEQHREEQPHEEQPHEEQRHEEQRHEEQRFEEQSKMAAADAALALVESGMILGLGTGSTAKHVTIGIARRLAEGSLERIRAVPTSEATRALAKDLDIPLIELGPGGVDLAIDGMDEVDPRLDAIKGLGGALLREKIVASSATRFVLVGDSRKPVERLGERAPVPVEILPFGRARTIEALGALGLTPSIREEHGRPFTSDNGHMIVDCAFAPTRNAEALAHELKQIPGVLEHGFFLGLADLAYIAAGNDVHVLSRDEGSGTARR